MSNKRTQLDFDSLLLAYGDSNTGALDNNSLYHIAANEAGIPLDDLNRLEPIGKDGRKYSKTTRQIRWAQQSLKRMGLLEKTDVRGKWQLTHEGRKKVELRKAITGFSMLAFSTKLGIAIWGDSRHIFSQINEPITLTVSSPPYPIKYGRGYGKWREDEIIDLIIGVLEPIIANLVDGGSVMLNVGNDVFEDGVPSRSIYVEKLVIRMYETLGLRKMDTLIWYNPSKAPGPVQWANVERMQLSTGYEPILWMCNNPKKVRTDNRRVLQPISEAHQKLIDRGGEKRTSVNGDGTHTVRKGSFGTQVNGKIPSNVIRQVHQSKSSNEYRRLCKEHGLPVHGAMFPYELVEFLVKFASEEGELIADPFGGSLTSALVAHKLGRRFITADTIYEYLKGGSLRFGDEAEMNPQFNQIYTGYKCEVA